MRMGWTLRTWSSAIFLMNLERGLKRAQRKVKRARKERGKAQIITTTKLTFLSPDLTQAAKSRLTCITQLYLLSLKGKLTKLRELKKAQEECSKTLKEETNKICMFQMCLTHMTLKTKIIKEEIDPTSRVNRKAKKQTVLKTMLPQILTQDQMKILQLL
jgi:hypothetical protein